MSDVSDLKAEVLALRAENAELRKHVRMPDEPLEIDEKDFYVRAFIKWATEEQPEVKRLEAENEQLRELVGELYDELDAATQYDAGGGRGVVYEFADRMRELGIEADA